jgi:hypothetical protein
VSSLTPLTRLATNIASFLNLNLSKIHEQPKMVDEQHISGYATHDMSEDYLHALHDQLRLIDSGESLEDSYDPEMHQPFDLSWLYHLDSSLVSDSITQILTWSSSVSHPILAQWYGECNFWLYDKTPIANRIRADMSGFVQEIMSEIHSQHSSAASNGGQPVCCPCNQVYITEARAAFDFKQYTAATACLIARYGFREDMNDSTYRKTPDEWHFHAIILLVTILMDLEKNENYSFFKNFLVCPSEYESIISADYKRDADACNAAADATAALLTHGMQGLSVSACTMDMEDESASASGS